MRCAKWHSLCVFLFFRFLSKHKIVANHWLEFFRSQERSAINVVRGSRRKIVQNKKLLT